MLLGWRCVLKIKRPRKLADLDEYPGAALALDLRAKHHLRDGAELVSLACLPSTPDALPPLRALPSASALESSGNPLRLWLLSGIVEHLGRRVLSLRAGGMVAHRADELHRAGVRADRAVATENNQLNRLAFFEVVKRGANNRIAMKIDLAAIIGGDEAMVFDRNETIDVSL